MLSYVQDSLTRFNHSRPHKPQHQPYPHAKTTYVDKAQYATADDNSQLLSPIVKKFIQEVSGNFLYYDRTIDATMLHALRLLATQHAAPTKNTMTLVKQFLDYATTHPDAIIMYHASYMVLSAHSDTSYLSESKARSRAGGHFFMSNDSPIPTNIGAVVTIS